MFALRPRGAFVVFTSLAIVACGGGGSSEPTSTTPSTVSIVSGNGQVGLVGQALAVPLAVRVTADGAAARGVSVAFAVTAGAASVSPASAVTDTSGQAKTVVTLGSSPGSVTITASVTGTQLVATFVATAGSSTLTQACSAGSPTTPVLGTVTAGVSGTGICLGGGTTGAEYALVAFYGNTDSSAVQSLTVTGKGATGVTSASSITPNLDLTAGAGASLLRSRPMSLRAGFDNQLREAARRELTPLMSAARTQTRQRTASFSVIPSNPTVGSFVTLNTQALQACSQVRNRVSRIAAVSNNTIVVADTANPAGGFTDAEYLQFATLFDTLVSPLDIANFGAPSDVDGNRKIVIFFTKDVNALTPKNGSEGTIGGFFFERDLFPVTGSNGLQGCAGSNYAEMFYVLVPDPQGVYSVPHSKQNVLEITPSTLVHEYQHLINAGRRLYVNNADDFEDPWLNEGLSHVAEELLYYKVSGLSPRQNIGQQVFATQASVTAFNNYQLDNNGRYEIFIGKPNQTAVYGGTADVALEIRGAAWHLLRYLADHRGTSDGDTWMQLVNSTSIGQANLAHLFGASYMTQIRDWATSVFTDDFPAVTDARFLEPSWNMRYVFPRLVDSQQRPLGKYPLTVVPVSDATPANVSVAAGGAAYLRFSVAPNGQASIDWSAGGLPVSPLMQFTVVRTK
ncbi:MAG TPA: hypothetical protein VIP11_06935 [Gemmatimonadaceae bacterium]